LYRTSNKFCFNLFITLKKFDILYYFLIFLLTLKKHATSNHFKIRFYLKRTRFPFDLHLKSVCITFFPCMESRWNMYTNSRCMSAWALHKWDYIWGGAKNNDRRTNGARAVWVIFNYACVTLDKLCPKSHVSGIAVQRSTALGSR